MNTWKLTIKPDSKRGYDAFNICKVKSLLGVGWSGAYAEKQANNIDEAKELVELKYGKWPHAIKYLFEDAKEGDHFWIHQEGCYYLCKAEDEILFGNEIDDEFLKYDLGHARKAKWIEIPERYVSGSVQRGTIAPRMIQKIHITENELKFHKFIFSKFVANTNWQPKIEEEELSRLILNIKINDLFSLMSPDDFEDIISSYLQVSKKWVLIKSTCFRSKPKFEFSMLNRDNNVCKVQVKSGKYPNQLHPSKYSRFVSEDNEVYLFSTNKTPSPEKSIRGITAISHKDIFDWVKENIWSLTMPLKMRLWILLNETNTNQLGDPPRAS